MANKQKVENCTVQDPIIIDFSDDDLVSLGETQREDAAEIKMSKYVPKTRIDLVMWTHNSEKTLAEVLQRIQEVIPSQYINRKIITDDYSKDRTREIAKDFGWEVHLNNGSGLNDNTKTAISLVSAPIFCSFEHDIILARDWWQKLSKLIKDPSVVVAQGTRVSTNSTFRMLDDYINKRGDISHETLDNCIAKTEIVRKFGYNEVGTPPKLKAERLKWIVEQTVTSDHIRESTWENIKHDFRMQSLVPVTSKQRLLFFRILLTSLIRSTYVAYKTNCPMLLLLYPLDRLAIFLASFKKA
jgi:glycosyltransferase involved in cell wall biosynthesis